MIETKLNAALNATTDHFTRHHSFAIGGLNIASSLMLQSNEMFRALFGNEEMRPELSRWNAGRNAAHLKYLGTRKKLLSLES